MPQNKTKLGDFQNDLYKQGRSGFDPLDTARMAGSIDGLFLRRLFTLTLRTRNIFSLIVMLLFGIVATGFMGLALYVMISRPIVRELDFTGYLAFAGLYSILGLVFCIGIALLLNFGINFTTWTLYYLPIFFSLPFSRSN